MTLSTSQVPCIRLDSFSFDELLGSLTRIIVSGSRNGSLSLEEHEDHSNASEEQISRTYSSSGESDAHDTSFASALADVSSVNSQVTIQISQAGIL